MEALGNLADCCVTRMCSPEGHSTCKKNVFASQEMPTGEHAATMWLLYEETIFVDVATHNIKYRGSATANLGEEHLIDL